ncbi:sulfatase-like hydrolase/transferase [Nocardioides dongxiaopingii]|uniref:sulfatase-like hydrolase/transferase n=1 Tax=Nocardioides sp. S-1144 TaxID=2582905 RepID=UPI0011629925|nr:sulfatase-like hydrolase/transferase [Nocardioides sp. S-1144]QDH10766.1 sulfatase-like hydrolase/transferase [Nocardioides sp. S-1144]
MQVATVLVVVLLVCGAVVANVARERAADDPAGVDLGLSLGAGATSNAPSAEPTTGQDPGSVRNAIVFLVDDMHDFSCAEAGAYLPRSSPWLVDRGTCYEHATTSTPVCCPARAQLQTGQYSHNNKVVRQKAAHLLTVDDTVQRDLGRAGLSTYGIGKNLNGVKPREYYGRTPLRTGFEDFDFWNSYQGRPGRFRLYDDTGRRYLPDNQLNSTETNGAYLSGFLDGQLVSGDPFFVYDAFFAPHKQGARFAPRHMPPVPREFASAPVPPFRYAPERFARDKLPLFHRPDQDRAYYRQLFTARARSLLGVDEQMAIALQRLEDTGVLDETAVFFVSDNGYTDQGEVNWEGKSIPYPAAMNVPMLAYYPGRAPATDLRDVALVDVAPTLYDLLDVTPGHLLDGHSLLGDHERKVVYGEFYAEANGLVRQESGPRTSNLRSWRMVRRGRESYVEWYDPRGRTVFREFYTARAMTRNKLFHTRDADAPSPAKIREFRRLLQRHGSCRGTVEAGSPRACG